ncbi:uncharacterized protein [Cherax quadricarinatus]
MDEQQEGMDVKLVDASCVHEEPMEVGSSCTYAEPHISKDETTNIGNAGVVLHGTKKMAEDLPDDRKAGFLHCNDEGLYPATCIHKQIHLPSDLGPSLVPTNRL